MVLTTPRFDPWIGHLYGERSAFGCALMVLGESHQCEETRLDLTEDAIAAHLSTHKHAFYTNLGHALGQLCSVDENAVFDHLLFYSYIQGCVDIPGQAPKKEMWQEADTPFLGVLARHRPRVLLVLGGRLWDGMTTETAERVAKFPGNSTLSDAVKSYDAAGALGCYAGVLGEPSGSRFIAAEAQERVRYLLALALGN
jgi:hypothetical protein